MREIWFALLFLMALAAAFPAAAQAPQTASEPAALLQVTPQDRVLGQSRRADHDRRIRLDDLPALRPFRQ